MSKYKIMLILPFVIMVLAAWGTLGSGSDEEARLLAEQQELIKTANLFAEDEIYSRAADALEEAIKLNVGDTDSIEASLLEYYLADENRESWLSLQIKRIKKASASEDDIIQVAEYYKNRKKYNEMIDITNSGLLLFPQSEKLNELKNSVIYYYSYQKFDYQDTAPAFGGSIAVCKDGKWGYASRLGESSGEFPYNGATSFCKKRAAVDDGNEIYFITDNMKKYSVCHDTSVDGVFLYDGSRAVLTASDKYLLADDEMKIIGEAYDFIGSVSENMRPAQRNGKWFFIDNNGQKALSEEYDGIALNGKYSAFFDGTAFVLQNGSYRMINTDGEFLNDKTFEDAYPFIEENSLAAVKKDGKWGFANADGEIVIPCAYEAAKSFSYGLAAVRTEDKWGYIDLNGKFIIPASYDSAEPFENKRAFVCSDESCGVIYLNYYQ